MVFLLVKVQFFLYTRAQIDAPAGFEAHYARNNSCTVLVQEVKTNFLYALVRPTLMDQKKSDRKLFFLTTTNSK